MLLVPCPWCGPREEIEFRDGGQAGIAYPSDPDALSDEAWADFLFMRDNPKGAFAEREREAWIKSTHDEQKALTAMDPDTFFVPPYVGPSGWVGVRIGTVDPDELRELVTEAWRLTAPKRLVQAVDEAEAV